MVTFKREQTVYSSVPRGQGPYGSAHVCKPRVTASCFIESLLANSDCKSHNVNDKLSTNYN